MPDNDYTYLCALGALKKGAPRRFEVGGVQLSLVLVEEQVFAIHDTCSHSAVSLSEGEVEGCTIECWLHASRFDLRTGEPLEPPATRSVPVYPVRIEEGKVYVRVTGRD
ncbi:non-heme iron oxygenase ferredoxin subunit [Streptomyces sp. NPDC001604]|uniref:non-heme iron oxygenase ferredoxin subunit n=1 Tax=Streptomyces sp. NPDC001604 TaxID=3364593 RepID=UPI003678424D